MITRSPKPSLSPRLAGDGGSVMVESAIILPILLVMLAGLVDFGGAFRNRITIQGAVRSAARAESVMGNNAAADKFSLTTLWAGMSTVSNTTLNEVTVFKTDSNGLLTTNCKNLTPDNTNGKGLNSGADVCNVYSGYQTQNAGTVFQLANAGCTSGWDRWYCPSTRKIDLTGPPDYLGFAVEVTYTPYTKVFGSSFKMTDQQVMRLEPPAA